MIGLAGSHRVGKSTLAVAYAHFAKAEFIETKTAQVFERLGLDPKLDYSFAERIAIQNHILTDAINLYKGCKGNSITDRTPMDMLAYTMADVQRENMNLNDMVAFADYADRCYTVTNRYFSSIVVVQPGIPLIEAPGKAPANKAYVEHIATLVMGLVVDDRLKVGRHYIGRHNLELNSRVRSVVGAMNSIVKRHTDQMGAGERFH